LFVPRIISITDCWYPSVNFFFDFLDLVVVSCHQFSVLVSLWLIKLLLTR